MLALRGAAQRREREAPSARDAVVVPSHSHARELAPSPPDGAKPARDTQRDSQSDAPAADALAGELTQLAEARTTTDAQRIAGSLRAKLGPSASQSYLKLVDTLVERAREHERLGRLAGSDELTGIANRRSFNDALRRELARTSRDGRPLSLLLLDLDGLKLINDGMGHAAGDRALRILARCASETVRHGDLVARIGGDEFAVLLPNTETSTAQAVAQRIRDRLDAACSAEPELRVGVSIGIAVATDATRRIDLLREADAELYRDKARTRATVPEHAELSRAR